MKVIVLTPNIMGYDVQLGMTVRTTDATQGR